MICLMAFFVFDAIGQTDQGLIPFANKTLLNPSYAGFNKDESIWTSSQFTTLPHRDLLHVYTLTYDTWSERFQGGIGINFYNGVRGIRNTTLTGLGITFARPIKAGAKHTFSPSLNLTLYSATKQWFVWAIDELFAQKTAYYSNPGKDYFRYNLIRPTAGVLWSSTAMQGGISGSYALQSKLKDDAKNNDDEPLFHLLLHFSMDQWNRRRGLRSLPVKSGPDLLLMLSETKLVSKTGYRVEDIKHLYGLYLQNEYTTNTYGVTALYGWKFANFHVSVTAGTAISISGECFLYYGEASLGLKIPYNHYNKKRPWAPVKKSYQ